MKNSIPFLVLNIFVFAFLKFLYNYLDADALQFLLKPTNSAIELLLGTKAVYSVHSGYFHSSLDITIDKSCSGYTFLLICYLMTSFVFLRSEAMKKRWIIPSSLFLAYIVTLIANISRISGYLLLLNRDIPLRFDPQNAWIHQAEGVFVYLSFLILLYLALNYLITKNRSTNEKIA